MTFLQEKQVLYMKTCLRLW